MATFFRVLSVLKSTYESDKEYFKPKLDVVYTLENFVKEGSYTNYKNKDILLKYWDSPDTFVAEKMNTTRDAVRAVRTRLSKILFSIVPLELLNELKDCKDNDERKLAEIKHKVVICISTNNFLDLFYDGFIEMIKSKVEESYENEAEEGSFEDGDDFDSNGNLMLKMNGDLKKEYNPEITFLRYFSKFFSEQVIQNINIKNLDYIISILEGKNGTASDRVYLYDAITSKNFRVPRKMKIDGKMKVGLVPYLYPPMRVKIGNKFVDANELSSSSIREKYYDKTGFILPPSEAYFLMNRTSEGISYNKNLVIESKLKDDND